VELHAERRRPPGDGEGASTGGGWGSDDGSELDGEGQVGAVKLDRQRVGVGPGLPAAPNFVPHSCAKWLQMAGRMPATGAVRAVLGDCPTEREGGVTESAFASTVTVKQPQWPQDAVISGWTGPPDGLAGSAGGGGDLATGGPAPAGAGAGAATDITALVAGEGSHPS
jgi:hypothetical protein